MAQGVVFVLIGGGQVFFKSENRETSRLHVRKYIDSLKQMEESKKEAFLFADDAEGNHLAMIRCSQVVGYMTFEEEEEWKR